MNKLANISYGSTAAIVTSMALIVGLGSLKNSRASLIAALLVIAITDNITDSFSIHIYQESTSETKSTKTIAITNYVARLIVASSFILIAIILHSNLCKVIAVIWGMTLLISLSYLIVRKRNTNVGREIMSHILLALVVIVVSQLLGSLINKASF